MANLLPPPEKLDLEGDNATIALRWERWKRSFNIYLDATEITGDEKRRATLLLLGGSELQEIIYNLPGAFVDAIEGIDVFKTAVEKLDEYFLPKQNRVYERHIFRQIKQEEGEKFEKFVVRLRNQAGKCKFSCSEENLIDQIVEKCSSSELRKKILTLGDTVTLDKVIIEANTLEAVGYQLEGYGQSKNTTSNSSDINAIKNRFTKPGFSKLGNGKCGRCGHVTHTLPNQECPARKKTCHACGKIGHFSALCRTRPQKRKQESKQNEDQKYKRKKQEKEVNSIDEETAEEYVFNMNEDDDAMIECVMGGVNLEMLIDSGCKLNLITEKAWEKLKMKGVKVYNQIKGSEKNLFPYGSKTALDVKGTFDTTIKTNGRSVQTKVYVINGGSRNLLGKETAISLGVLKLGIGVQEITQTHLFQN